MEANHLLVLSNEHKDVSWRTPLPPGPLIWFSHMSPSNTHNCRSKQTPSNTPMTSSITHQVRTELCMKPDVDLDRTRHILDMPIQLGSKGTAGELDPCDWKNWSAVIFHGTQIGFPTECNAIPVSARDALIDRWRTIASHPPREKLPNSHSRTSALVRTLLMDLKGQFTPKKHQSVIISSPSGHSRPARPPFFSRLTDSMFTFIIGKNNMLSDILLKKNKRRWQNDHVWVNYAFNLPFCS